MHRAKAHLRFTTMTTTLIGVVTLGFAPPGTASGQSAPVKATIQVVETGLNNPRKVTWDAQEGRVVVAEAGRSCGDGTGNCFAETGSIFAYEPGEDQGRRIVTGLPTLTLYFGGRAEVIGVSEINTQSISGWGSDYLAAIGLGYTVTAADRAAFGPDALPLGHVARITRSGEIIRIADLVTFEGEHNPDGLLVECNPNGMVTDSTGSIVADAAGNDILRVTPTGEVSVLDVPPRVDFQDRQIDSVPTSIVRGPDGAYYVGELTGFPFPVGYARVWRLAPGQNRTLVASGLTNIIDLAFDRRGRLLVLELTARGLLSGDPTGRLVRIEPTGEHTVLAREGLVFPGGMEVVPNGDIYITNHTNGPDGGGELLRIRRPG